MVTMATANTPYVWPNSCTNWMAGLLSQSLTVLWCNCVALLGSHNQPSPTKVETCCSCSPGVYPEEDDELPLNFLRCDIRVTKCPNLSLAPTKCSNKKPSLHSLTVNSRTDYRERMVRVRMVQTWSIRSREQMVLRTNSAVAVWLEDAPAHSHRCT